MIANKGCLKLTETQSQWYLYVFPQAEEIMAKVCEICGKGPQFGHRVSHAHNLTNRRWNPNLQVVRAVVNGTNRKIRVCTQCIKSGRVQKPAVA